MVPYAHTSWRRSYWRLEAEKILHDLYGTDFLIFVLVSFVFSLNFAFNLDFSMQNKTYLKNSVFEILFIGDYKSTFYLFDDKV